MKYFSLLYFYTLCILASNGTVATNSNPYCITSADTTLTLCVDTVTGKIISLTPNSNGQSSYAWSSNISTILGSSTIRGTPMVTQPNSTTIMVQTNWLFTPSSSPYVPSNAGAIVTDIYTSTPSSIRWTTKIVGTSSLPWSVPIQTRIILDSNLAANELKIWSAWDRGSYFGWNNGDKYIDPLMPSDVLPAGWWDGEYRYGNPRGSFSDFFTLPIVSLLSANPSGNDIGDNGISLILDPSNPPLDLWMFTRASESGYYYEHHHFRIQSDITVTLNGDFVAHAADWRPAIGWLYQSYPEYLEPVNTEVFVTCAGTGSYSYYMGNLTNPALDLMDYAVNWDLSGRYFPYMGQFLPPVADGVEWLNDPEGSQPRANVTFEIIGNWYRSMINNNFTDLSYFNVNEYGINIVLPPTNNAHMNNMNNIPRLSSRPTSKHDLDKIIEKVLSPSIPSAIAQLNATATCVNDWQNASACLISDLLDSLVVSSWDEIGQRVVSGAYYSWQNAVVVDPGVSSYHDFMLEQLVRHIVYEDAFAGIIIDRSDWQDVYNFHVDDGISFIPEAVNNQTNPPFTGIASSMKVTYGNMIHDLRTTIQNIPYILNKKNEYITKYNLELPTSKATPVGNGIMMMNGLGNSRLDNYRYYDGTFSEGYAVNGEGFLSAFSPGILWTYDSSECCTSVDSAGIYLQTHIYMGLAPMLPFPDNDHSIDWNMTSATLYSRYGNLFQNIVNKVWITYPHIISLHNQSSSIYAKINAFLTVSNISSTLEQIFTIPVMLGENSTGNVYIQLTDIDRVWKSDTKVFPNIFPNTNKNLHIHPYLRSTMYKEEANYVSLLKGSTYTVEVLYPGIGNTWLPLLTTSQTSFVLTVPLQENCALVRIRNQ